MSAVPGRASVAATVAAAGLDLLAHRLSQPAARAAARFTSAALVILIARAAGVPWAGLGLGRPELGSGLRTGAAAGAGVAAAAAASRAFPAPRWLFADERAAAAAGRGQLAMQLARITFTAVPPEELIYRSALLGLWLGRGNRATAVAWSSVLFGLSHILPTLSTMDQTALHSRLAGRALRQAGVVGGNVAVTGLAGAALSWLRLRSGSVVAPVLAHAALNDAALLAGRAVQRQRAERARGAAGPRP